VVEVEVDVNVLEARLAPLGVTGLRPLAGGASSLSYLARASVAGSERRVVVKVAPAGLAPVRNRDVLRQARLLRRLRATDVPVPEVLWEDPGAPPDEPPLFVMTFVEGASFEPLFDQDGTDDVGVVGRRLHAAARVLAALHSLDPETLALGDEPPVALADEVGRWTRLLGTVDAALVPGWERVADRLLATAPPEVQPAVVHGDFRLGNVLAAGPDITAVIDWEIWSIGDPRVDLGWFLVNADPETYRRGTRYAGGLPGPAELAQTYSVHLGRSVAAVEWFQALACFKSAATWALIVKHNRRRPAPDATPEEVAGSLPSLLARAADLAG
jgi:aminoglycoside phosphotransferase (APT) family kinase protein